MLPAIVVHILTLLQLFVLTIGSDKTTWNYGYLFVPDTLSSTPIFVRQKYVYKSWNRIQNFSLTNISNYCNGRAAEIPKYWHLFWLDNACMNKEFADKHRNLVSQSRRFVVRDYSDKYVIVYLASTNKKFRIVTNPSDYYEVDTIFCVQPSPIHTQSKSATEKSTFEHVLNILLMILPVVSTAFTILFLSLMLIVCYWWSCIQKMSYRGGRPVNSSNRTMSTSTFMYNANPNVRYVGAIRTSPGSIERRLAYERNKIHPDEDGLLEISGDSNNRKVLKI